MADASTSASKVEHCSTLNHENPENLRSPAHNAVRRKVRESDVNPFKVNGQKRFKIFLMLLCGRSVSVCFAPLTGPSQRVELQDFCFTHVTPLFYCLFLTTSNTARLVKPFWRACFAAHREKCHVFYVMRSALVIGMFREHRLGDRSIGASLLDIHMFTSLTTYWVLG